MSPNRPYLFRAFYDWIVDNDHTPYVLVDATVSGTLVPAMFVEDGQIVLNIAPHACGNFSASNEAISFNARFQGKVETIFIPFAAVRAIYSRESGAGSVFEDEYELDYEETLPSQSENTPKEKSNSVPKAPHLSVIK